MVVALPRVSAGRRYVGASSVLVLWLIGGSALEASVQVEGVQVPGARLTSESLVEQPGVPARLSQARAYKDMGDAYVDEESLAAAADAYGQALSVGREVFTADERVEMAIYLSWEDRLDDASQELRLVLSEYPGHIGARSHLARVYSWSGDLGRSIDEAETVLDASPGNPSALLVKADALQWQGYFRSAIPLYEEVLESDAGFDARIGLSNALLAGGNRTRALENARLLSPATPRQSEQADELTRSIRAISRPRVDLRHNYYEDSDENRNHRYSLLYAFGLGNHDFALQLARTDSQNATGTTQSRQANFGFTSFLTEGTSIGGGVGLTQPRSGSWPNLMTGRFGITSSVSNGAVGATVSSDVFTDTTELIENRIRVVTYGATAEKPVSDRVRVSGAYNYKDLSDGNHAHDISVAPEIVALFSPRISFGYQFRFQDYLMQSQSGYFDPDRYFANRFFSSLYYESATVYTYVNAFVGKQQYTRNLSATDDVVLGGALSIGFMPAESVSIEVNAEGGNFAAGSVSGFTYFNLGSQVRLIF